MVFDGGGGRPGPRRIPGCAPAALGFRLESAAARQRGSEACRWPMGSSSIWRGGCCVTGARRSTCARSSSACSPRLRVLPGGRSRAGSSGHRLAVEATGRPPDGRCPRPLAAIEDRARTLPTGVPGHGPRLRLPPGPARAVNHPLTRGERAVDATRRAWVMSDRRDCPEPARAQPQSPGQWRNDPRDASRHQSASERWSCWRASPRPPVRAAAHRAALPLQQRRRAAPRQRLPLRQRRPQRPLPRRAPSRSAAPAPRSHSRCIAAGSTTTRSSTRPSSSTTSRSAPAAGSSRSRPRPSTSGPPTPS